MFRKYAKKNTTVIHAIAHMTMSFQCMRVRQATY
jgi:hypothetical protein